jgi:tRNA nucleotidyltransferase (CCA-adding enzyme)
MTVAASELGARVEELVGMDRVLPALAGLPPAYLVGGAVRDLLLGAGGVDLDLAFEGDARAAARELAHRLGGEAEDHERFGTASVQADDLRLDLATARRERYRHPGELPEVEPAPIVEDLGRRDFSVNAMAIALADAQRGRLLDPHGGRADLEAATIRVLHRHSFVDDPTRILRGVRLEARLGFAFDPETEALARAAVVERVLDTVSRNRLGHELMVLLGESRRREALARLVDLEASGALHPALVDVDVEAAAAAGRAAEVTGADPALAGLAGLLAARPHELEGLVAGLGLDAETRGRAVRAARSAPALANELRADAAPSDLHRLLHEEPPEALALSVALGAPPNAVSRYLGEVAGVALEIGGDDLVAAGVEPSAAIGRALEETLRRKLDGRVAGRDEELRCALRLALGEDGDAQ